LAIRARAASSGDHDHHGSNVALPTGCILAVFQGSEVMVHRDMRRV